MDYRRQRPTVVLTRRLSGGQTTSATSGALAIHYHGPIEPIPVISSLTCAFGTELEHPSCITFQHHPSRRSFQLLAPLSLRGFVDMFSQRQVGVILPQSIHQVNPRLAGSFSPRGLRANRHVLLVSCWALGVFSAV
jgi:hypothetical protein